MKLLKIIMSKSLKTYCGSLTKKMHNGVHLQCDSMGIIIKGPDRWIGKNFNNLPTSDVYDSIVADRTINRKKENL